jgi:hypothetical protein
MTSLFSINLHRISSHIDFSSDKIFFFIKAYVNEKEKNACEWIFWGVMVVLTTHENADNEKLREAKMRKKVLVLSRTFSTLCCCP